MAFVPDQQQPAPAQPAAASRFVPDAPKKPYDPMTDAPRLPGEEGYSAPRAPQDRSGVMQALKYVGDYLGGLKDAAIEPVAAPGRQGGAVDQFVADVGDVPLLGHAYGAAESATTALTSAVAPALASLKGAVTGIEPTNADIEDLTYSPRTSVGAGINKVASAAMKPVADVAEATGADAALLPLAPELNAISSVPRVPKTPKAAPTPPNMADPATAARAAGYKLLPSEAGGGKVLQGLESLAGPNTKKDFRRANEATTTKLAKDEIGAPSVDDRGIAKVRAEGDAAYEAMSGIGRVQADDQVKTAIGKLAPRQGMRANADIAGLQAQFEGLLDQPWDAGAVVTEVRQLRKEANANSAPPALGAKPDPKKTALAKAQLQVANALDDWLERNAAAVGSPEVAQQYKAARTRLAKTASVERASAGGKTDVRNLERQDDRGVPHSGRLKIASQTGEYFPESTGSVNGPEINVTPDSLFGTVRQFAQSNLLRPIISRLLQSDMVQNRFGQALGDVGPDSPLGMYFDQPAPAAPYQPFSEAPAGSPLPRTSAESMRQANTLAGDLGLEPEGPTPNFPPSPAFRYRGPTEITREEFGPAPTREEFFDEDGLVGGETTYYPPTGGETTYTPRRDLDQYLSADTPPPITGDIPFTPTDLSALAAELGIKLGPDVVPGNLPGGQSPRAAGMAGNLTSPDLNEFTLAEDFVQPPLALEAGPEITNLDFPYGTLEDAPVVPGQPISAGELNLGELMAEMNQLGLRNRPSIANRSPLPPAQVTANDFMDFEAGNATPGQVGAMLDAGYLTGDAAAPRITAEGRRARAQFRGEPEMADQAMQMQQQQQQALGEAFSVQPSLRPGYSVLRGQGDAGVEVDNATLGELFGDLNAPVTPIAATPTRAGRPLVTEQEFQASGGFKEKPAVKQTAPKKSEFTSERNAETGEISIESPDGAVIVRPRGQYLRVNYAQVKGAKRGKGKGVALYEEAVRQAGDQGLQLASDIKVSPEAARVYDALERRGYTITRNDYEIDDDGQLVSTNSAKPIFVVESGPAE